MDLIQLKYFVSLAQELNFTRVAEKFFVSQPAVSHQIARLEDEIGAKLFIRTKHGVSLSKAGAICYRRAVEIIDTSERAILEVSLALKENGGLIKLSTVPSSADFSLRCIPAFSKKFPQVHLDLEISTGTHQLYLMNKNACDCFHSFVDLLESVGRYNILKLDQGRFYILVNSEIAKTINANDFSSLSQYALLTEGHAEGPYLANKIQPLCREVGITPKSICHYKSFDGTLYAVNAGLGFGILPWDIDINHFNDLVAFPINAASAVYTNGLAWDPNSQNEALYNFIDIVKEQYSIHDDLECRHL